MAALSPRPQPPLPAIRYKDTQAEAEVLLAEALGEHPPMSGLTMRANAVRLLVSMWYCHGSTKFPRGWVTPAMQTFLDLGLDCPNARVWRSYRSDIQDNPEQFLTTNGAPNDLIRQMELDLMGSA